MTLHSLKTTALAGLAAITLTGCSPTIDTNVRMSKFEIDQVVRDHDGVRIIYTDSQDFVHESKLYDKRSKNGNQIPFSSDALIPAHLRSFVKTYVAESEDGYGILRTLSADKKPEVVQVEFSNGAKYYEIHLPKQELLTPGSESYQSGKSTTKRQMFSIQ